MKVFNPLHEDFCPPKDSSIKLFREAGISPGLTVSYREGTVVDTLEDVDLFTAGLSVRF